MKRRLMLIVFGALPMVTSGCPIVDLLNESLGRNETTIGNIIDDKLDDFLGNLDN